MLKDIIDNFAVDGEFVSAEPYGNGHINKTFLLSTKETVYILQTINTYAFPDVDMLMNNIHLVTTHMAKKGDEVLEIVPTKDGKLYYKDGDLYYRIYVFVKNSICHEKIDNVEQIEKAAMAFGNLHKRLADLDASQLGEVIPNFHNKSKRYNDFLEAKNADILGRLKNCKNEAKMIMNFANEYSKIIDGMNDGTIHKTVTHNDPKINNVLFDAETEEVRCVIDLDTVMPGSVLFDFGDALRSLFTGDNEDSEDLELLKVDDEIYTHYLKGYLKEMKGTLTPREIELLPFSAFLLTIECGMRFLEDYLKGDVYFHTAYETHNLVRARTQITLAADIYENIPRLNKITQKVLKSIK